MGNREALLEGAKRCLYEKGYARTTIRDVAAASDVSMAAVGYHFGSMEALLNTALLAAIDDWGAQFASSLTDDGQASGTVVGTEYEMLWTRVLQTFSTHRDTGVASLEALVQAQRSPTLHQQLAAGQREGRRGLVAQLLGIDEGSVVDAEMRTLGSVQLALVTGLLMQSLTDPQELPTAAEVVVGLRAIARLLGPDRAAL